MSTLLNLSEKEEEYITDNPNGSGLIKFGKDIVPLENEFPKKQNFTDFYKQLQRNLHVLNEKNQKNKDKKTKRM